MFIAPTVTDPSEGDHSPGWVCLLPAVLFSATCGLWSEVGVGLWVMTSWVRSQADCHRLKGSVLKYPRQLCENSVHMGGRMTIKVENGSQDWGCAWSLAFSAAAINCSSVVQGPALAGGGPLCLSACVEAGGAC